MERNRNGLCQSSASARWCQCQCQCRSCQPDHDLKGNKVEFKLRPKWTCLRVGATRVWCIHPSRHTRIHRGPHQLSSTRRPGTQYPTRHGHRFRLRIFRHIGRRSARRSRESRTKFRLFVLLQDLCPWSIHSRSLARLSPWANIFPPLEREALQVVRIVPFLPHFGSHPNCYL